MRPKFRLRVQSPGANSGRARVCPYPAMASSRPRPGSRRGAVLKASLPRRTQRTLRVWLGLRRRNRRQTGAGMLPDLRFQRVIRGRANAAEYSQSAGSNPVSSGPLDSFGGYELSHAGQFDGLPGTQRFQDLVHKSINLVARFGARLSRLLRELSCKVFALHRLSFGNANRFGESPIL